MVKSIVRAGCVLAAALPMPAAAQTLLWARQMGAPGEDFGWGVAVDGAGNAYITGHTSGSRFGPHAGGEDAFLVRYDASGTVLWTRQDGTQDDEQARGGVAADREANAYITGTTHGSFGGPNAGEWDIFLAKYDASGGLRWTRQLGTSATDGGEGVAVDDAGNAYITGYTDGSLGGPPAGDYDMFLVRYDGSGELLWVRQAGTPAPDFGYGVAVDRGGNAYVTGYTDGSLGGPNAGSSDAFLAKYDTSGELLWMRQFGTPGADFGYGVAVDGAGNACVAGDTTGGLGGPNAGGQDVFLAKYNESGELLGAVQAGTPGDDSGRDVAVDDAGSPYITGHTRGSLGGPNAGATDIFLAKYDASGALLWVREPGTSDRDYGRGVAADGAGNAYITGWTHGSLGGPFAGMRDVFLVKYGPSPCYADCDESTGAGARDIFDFLCFLNRYAVGASYACDCDESTGPGVCDVLDFLCFRDRFAAGCP